ncbi:MAG: DEAD/DEAH box helicase [Deltaproteobacteria bacterium]|nr:DEAD/DEAH box helicase [Deltaproteobacteria bacterium]
MISDELQIALGKNHRPFEFQITAYKLWKYSRKNISIDTPPGSGKTAVPMAAFLNSGSSFRGVMILPLKALVHEKYNLFKQKNSKDLKAALITGDEISGDDSFIYSTDGIIVFSTWEFFKFNLMKVSWDLVVIDEIQNLINTSRSGILISIITGLKSSGTRMIISGYGFTSQTEGLISPCEKIIEKSDITLSDFSILEKKPEALWKYIISEYTKETAFIVFVSTRKSCEVLLKKFRVLSEKNSKILPEQIEIYHSGLSIGRKTKLLQNISTLDIRIVISTTALAQGMDLPFTHVIIRDINIFSRGKLTESEIIQMAGRAGRRGIRARTAICDDIKLIKDEKFIPLKNYMRFILEILTTDEFSWETISETLSEIYAFRKYNLRNTVETMRMSGLLKYSSNTYQSVSKTWPENFNPENWCNFSMFIKKTSPESQFTVFDLVFLMLFFELIEWKKMKIPENHIPGKILEIWNSKPEQLSYFLEAREKTLKKYIQKTVHFLEYKHKHTVDGMDFYYILLKNIELPGNVKNAFISLSELFR